VSQNVSCADQVRTQDQMVEVDGRRGFGQMMFSWSTFLID
jgi:hypothetical protein